MKNMYEVLIGLSYKIVELSNDEYNKIIDYGKCVTDEVITVNIDGVEYSSKDIDDIIKL